MAGKHGKISGGWPATNEKKWPVTCGKNPEKKELTQRSQRTAEDSRELQAIEEKRRQLDCPTPKGGNPSWEKAHLGEGKQSLAPSKIEVIVQPLLSMA